MSFGAVARWLAALAAAAPFASAQPQQAREPEIRFVRPEPAPRDSFRRLERDGRAIAVELAASLPGLASKQRLPFAEPLERVMVYVSKASTTSIVVSGGVRRDLEIHAYRRDGRVSQRFAGGRLLEGFEVPLCDSTSSLLAVVFETRAGVQLRCLSLRGDRPLILLARTLDRVPDRLQLRMELGSPRVAVSLGALRARAPGGVEWRPVEALSFLHPLAKLPELSVVSLDFGGIARGAVAKRAFRIANRGRLTLRLLLEARDVVAPFKLSLEPRSLTVPPGAVRRVDARLALEDAGKGPALRGRVLVRVVSGGGEALQELSLRAEQRRPADRQAPVIDKRLVRATLLAGRRARIRGRPGAVRDASPPLHVGPAHVRASHPVEGDGSFDFEVELPIDGRVRLWAEDAKKNRSAAKEIARLADLEAPVLRAELITLSLPQRGEVVLGGQAGAVADLTPPLWIVAEVEGARHGARIAVAADGSFSAPMAFRPGARVRVAASDAAARRNESAFVAVGRMLPFVQARRGARLSLHGPASVAFRIEAILDAKNDAPAVVLRRFEGRLDAKGRVDITPRHVRNADRIRYSIRSPTRGRWVTGTYALR